MGRHLLVLHKFVRENSEEIINNRLFSQEEFLEIADGVFQQYFFTLQLTNVITHLVWHASLVNFRLNLHFILSEKFL